MISSSWLSSSSWSSSSSSSLSSSSASSSYWLMTFSCLGVSSSWLILPIWLSSSLFRESYLSSRLWSSSSAAIFKWTWPFECYCCSRLYRLLACWWLAASCARFCYSLNIISYWLRMSLSCWVYGCCEEFANVLLLLETVDRSLFACLPF